MMKCLSACKASMVLALIMTLSLSAFCKPEDENKMSLGGIQGIKRIIRQINQFVGVVDSGALHFKGAKKNIEEKIGKNNIKSLDEFFKGNDQKDEIVAKLRIYQGTLRNILRANDLDESPAKEQNIAYLYKSLSDQHLALFSLFSAKKLTQSAKNVQTLLAQTLVAPIKDANSETSPSRRNSSSNPTFAI